MTPVSKARTSDPLIWCRAYISTTEPQRYGLEIFEHPSVKKNELMNTSSETQSLAPFGGDCTTLWSAIITINVRPLCPSHTYGLLRRVSDQTAVVRRKMRAGPNFLMRLKLIVAGSNGSLRINANVSGLMRSIKPTQCGPIPIDTDYIPFITFLYL